ncbi:MAG: hypothetical protein ACTSRG_05885 [Candidatus Helarchaeota archaeon]
MRIFRRKKKKVEDETARPEIDKMVEALRQQVNSQEAQITTFREDIAPNMAQTIQVLKTEIDRLNKLVEQKDQELFNQLEMIKKISSESIKLQKEGATELLIKSQNEARIYKTQVLEQSKVIVDLQKKVNLLPTICNRLVDEINKRNESIQKLINQNDALKAENVKLSLDILELEKRLETTLKDIEEKEFKTRQLLNSVAI